MPGLPPDGAGASAPLASATVALIKRTICLPLNQTQIPFPSNAPQAPRDSGGSISHPTAQARLCPPPSIIHPRQLGGGVQEAGGGPGQVTRLPAGSCLPGLLVGTHLQRA